MAAQQQNRRATYPRKTVPANFMKILVGASLLAMVVNDDAGCLAPSGALRFIASELAPTGGVTYLPDLILVQLRVRIRWVAAGKSAIAYSLAWTSAGG
ncbi:hypothetical protein EJA72_24545 [Pseudomonas sp. PB120]|nr:hypothetical protein [Pseudomonas sp. PB120]